MLNLSTQTGPKSMRLARTLSCWISISPKWMAARCWLRSTKNSLKRIHTVILTNSEAEVDIVNGYQLHVNCHLGKPVHRDAFGRLVKSLNDFWRTRTKSPQQRQSG
jgi:hypothetical protein